MKMYFRGPVVRIEIEAILGVNVNEAIYLINMNP